ncbi:MAG TPA: NAD-dependent epimerase/dehydratase family protein [Candidatus Egerieimonas intestinavium]|uniref:NAD-dependent epimerase/dehydratase family protein n=1 Tax=Candidatus Egerieimonas intestinavium TaxID=2840777 RepID=A0A9D1JFE4_9FIRM|nr:NAD-dependent epimerase/dehydratase family protein [Candidatus Egerieimonas intestinavium]
MKRLYIITGAKGHVASTIIQYLRGQDCQIRGLILPTEEGQDDGQVTYYRGDVSRPETLEAIFADIDGREVIVIHAAGIISIADQVTPLLYRVNVEGTRNIIRQCMRCRVKRLVYISSVHAIPEKAGMAAISETSTFSGEAVTGAYAATKAEATRQVLEAVGQGLDAVVVHPSGIIGPYDKGNNHVVQLIAMYISGKLPAGVAGGYDFVDVRDVAKGCLLAAEKGRAGSCYILSNRYFTVGELLEYARGASGGRKKVCLPMGVARAFAPLFEWLARIRHTRPLYTKYALYTLSSNGHFSHSKATAELGYHPRDMGATVRDTIFWLKGGEVPLETA